MDKLQYKKGIAKEIREFLTRVSEDASAVNEIHKDYIQKTEALKAPNASQPKEPAQQKPPEAASVVGGGGR